MDEKTQRTQSLSAVGGSPGTITIGGKTYTVKPLTIRLLGEFERYWRSRQQDEYLGFYKKFQEAGRPIGYQERAIATSRIVSSPFGLDDAANAIMTFTGSRWLLLHCLYDGEQPIPEDAVDGMPAAEVIFAAGNVAVEAQFLQHTPQEVAAGAADP